jgi:hypothetical protein
VIVVRHASSSTRRKRHATILHSPPQSVSEPQLARCHSRHHHDRVVKLGAAGTARRAERWEMSTHESPRASAMADGAMPCTFSRIFSTGSHSAFLSHAW